jgi:hypothetical protein
MAKNKSGFRPPPPPDDGPGTPPPAEVVPWITPGPDTDTPDPVTLEITSPVTKTDRAKRDQSVTTTKRGDPVPYVFGTVLVKPPIQFIAKRTTNSGIYVDYIISAGECNNVIGRYEGSDPELIPMDKSFVAGFNIFMGEASQAQSPYMVESLGSYDTLNDICHIVARKNQYGSLTTQFLMEGIKLRDPRLSPIVEVFSSNPILALARVYTDCGYTVDDNSTADSAAYCDEQLGSPQMSRWTVDLPIFNRQHLDKWAHTLAQYCGGVHIDIRGGASGPTVYLIADKKVTSSPQISHSITADDIDKVRTTADQGLSKSPEQVIVHYRAADGTTPPPAIIGSAANGRISRLQMPGFSTYTMAARFATEVLSKAGGKVHEHVAYDKAIEPTLGELADITYAPHDLTAERMRLIDYRQNEIGRWWRKYRSYSDNDYSDATFTAPSTPAAQDLHDPYAPPAGPTLTLTQETFTAGGYNRFKVTWNGDSDWPYVQDYKVKVEGDQVVLDATVIHEGVGEHVVYTGPLTNDVEYTASIRTHSLYGPMGTTTTKAKTAAGGLTVTAKSFGGSGSPENYYQTGGGNFIDDSPLNWNGLIPATGSGDSYQKMTLVFCVYPVTLVDANWYIFGSEAGNIVVGNWDDAGGIWLGARSDTNQIKSIEATTPSGSPSDFGGLIPGQWNTVMIAYDGDSGSPESRALKIWANGSGLSSGDWGTTERPANQPMSHGGYCWVGRGDGFVGDPEIGMECHLAYVWCKEEYLDPAIYWDSFFDVNNKPMDLGATGSGPTGTQPDTYCPDGDFTANVGSGDNWTEIGTVPNAPSSPSD